MQGDHDGGVRQGDLCLPMSPAERAMIPPPIGGRASLGIAFTELAAPGQKTRALSAKDSSSAVEELRVGPPAPPAPPKFPHPILMAPPKVPCPSVMA